MLAGAEGPTVPSHGPLVVEQDCKEASITSRIICYKKLVTVVAPGSQDER